MHCLYLTCRKNWLEYHLHHLNMTVETTQRLVEQLFLSDPGVDDAMAILVAAAMYKDPAFIATYGNDATRVTADNLLSLGNFIQTNLKDSQKLRLAKGADRPFISLREYRPNTPDHNLYFIHGQDAMEGVHIVGNAALTSQKTIYQTAREQSQKVDLFSLGAATDLFYYMWDEKRRKNINSITVMGGVLFAQGNVDPHVEANMRHNPWAFRKVLQWAQKDNIDVTLVTLDITHDESLAFTPEKAAEMVDVLRQKGSHKIADLIEKFGTGTYSNFYRGREGIYEASPPYDEHKFPGPPIHDLTALMIQRHPELFQFRAEKLPVKVSKNGDVGSAAFYMNPDGYVKVVTGVKDAKKYWDLITEYLARYN